LGFLYWMGLPNYHSFLIPISTRIILNTQQFHTHPNHHKLQLYLPHHTHHHHTFIIGTALPLVIPPPHTILPSTLILIPPNHKSESQPISSISPISPITPNSPQFNPHHTLFPNLSISPHNPFFSPFRTLSIQFTYFPPFRFFFHLSRRSCSESALKFVHRCG